MKNILIAGTGIGGLAVGALLAKDGYNVTVYTLDDPVEAAYDWEDSNTTRLVEELTGVTLDSTQKGVLAENRYYSPSEKTPVETSFGGNPPEKMERKLLARLLTDYAKENGVQFVLHTKIACAVTQNARVTGVRTEDGQVICADLVIDACGVDSPVRGSLPDVCGIEQNYAEGEVFYAWRGIFNKANDLPPDEHAYELYLMHRGEPGMSWFITEQDSTDILLGRFRPFGQEKVDAEWRNFKKNHPQLGESLLRGGTFGKIPVRRPLAKMVCDGYAAIGDSAYMTYPMSGCGIDISIRAAHMLHACILADRDGCFTTQTLWKYNYDYICRHAHLPGVDILKNALLSLPPEKLDLLFDKRIVEASDLASGGAGTGVRELLGKVARGFFHLPTLLKTAKAALAGGSVAKVYKQIPAVYSEADFKSWKRKVDKTVIPLKNP